MSSRSYDEPAPPSSPSTDTSVTNTAKALRVLVAFAVKNITILAFLGGVCMWGYHQFDDRFQKLEQSRQADHEAIMRLESNVDALCTVNGLTPYRRESSQ